MSFDKHIRRKTNIWFIGIYLSVTIFLGIGLYLLNTFIGYFWKDYKDLTNVHPILYIIILPICMTMLFYKVSKGRRIDVTPIDIDKEEKYYNSVNRNKKIDNILK